VSLGAVKDLLPIFDLCSTGHGTSNPAVKTGFVASTAEQWGLKCFNIMRHLVADAEALLCATEPVVCWCVCAVATWLL
jgi:hypothetical protein